MAIEIIVVIFLILLGIALLIAEIFFLPGISIAGIAGALALVGGIVYAFVYLGNTAGFVTVGASVVIGIGAFVYLIKSNAMSRIALNTNIEATVDQTDLLQLHVGDKGKTISRLNPIGKSEFNNTIVEAKSFNGEFIEEGMSVEIVKVDSVNVLVQQIES